jgi:hypothetical protein
MNWAGDGRIILQSTGILEEKFPRPSDFGRLVRAEGGYTGNMT